jgi:acetyl-CoA carboxylase biotin carboxyl carrier protein|uniref:Biotin carboxyl carrier protein of acetyl-CoA carboxylase n=1 Tax=Thorea hispida TaxID=202687 RepID=A0A1C9CA84_9FLOR|nr:acetyl-CoA carboxylase biotin carboxyl carrier protein [Thorea hispida]AOM65300.1 acetyl-CoA carboxylase biotin carboxyl carrier protein [Thorea hispida]UNJ79147.1 acetyl-CoA carboxylase biotin carboxyl carrier protein [Thorea hispida]
MNFHLADLNNLLACTKNNTLDYLHIQIQEKKFEIVVNRHIIQEIKGTIRTFNPIKAQKHLNIEKNLKETIIHTKNDEKNIEYFTIVSPMVGTFYRTPAPGEPCFVEVNDIVNINQTVCIIEAMKLMNEIKAELQGIIVEILVKDGDIVDCGQALMKVETHKL